MNTNEIIDFCEAMISMLESGHTFCLCEAAYIIDPWEGFPYGLELGEKRLMNAGIVRETVRQIMPDEAHIPYCTFGSRNSHDCYWFKDYNNKEPRIRFLEKYIKILQDEQKTKNINE